MTGTSTRLINDKGSHAINDSSWGTDQGCPDDWGKQSMNSASVNGWLAKSVSNAQDRWETGGQIHSNKEGENRWASVSSDNLTRGTPQDTGDKGSHRLNQSGATTPNPQTHGYDWCITGGWPSRSQVERVVSDHFPCDTVADNTGPPVRQRKPAGKQGFSSYPEEWDQPSNSRDGAWPEVRHATGNPEEARARDMRSGRGRCGDDGYGRPFRWAGLGHDAERNSGSRESVKSQAKDVSGGSGRTKWSKATCGYAQRLDGQAYASIGVNKYASAFGGASSGGSGGCKERLVVKKPATSPYLIDSLKSFNRANGAGASENTFPRTSGVPVRDNNVVPISSKPSDSQEAIPAVAGDISNDNADRPISSMPGGWNDGHISPVPTWGRPDLAQSPTEPIDNDNSSAVRQGSWATENPGWESEGWGGTASAGCSGW